MLLRRRGDTLFAVALPLLDLRWHRAIDPATCFGVHYSPEHHCLLSHGEHEITRVSLAGEMMWRTGGKDIFTGKFRVVGDHVEAIDFNGEVYHIDIATGRTAVSHPGGMKAISPGSRRPRRAPGDNGGV